MSTENGSCITILYISHGGGPLPLLGHEGHHEMTALLKKLAAGMARPSAILVISAHWEAKLPTVTAGKQPQLLYDYSGFPEAAYAITYPAPGEPELARAVCNCLGENGIRAVPDSRQGFDHGVFVPLKIMYPEADIPCVQLSLLQGFSPAAHIDMGRALSNLSYDGLTVIGSGFSFHNMRAFFTPDTPETREMNAAFDRWLTETCSDTTLDEAERTRRLTEWEAAPHARYCHPLEDHLMPLHVCYGMAGKACSRVFDLKIMNKKASFFLWENGDRAF